jgi:hypothetical protein
MVTHVKNSGYCKYRRFIIMNYIFSQHSLFVFYKVLSINKQISLNSTARSASVNGFSTGLYFYLYFLFLCMYRASFI